MDVSEIYHKQLSGSIIKGRLCAKFGKIIVHNQKAGEKKGVKLKNTINSTWQKSTVLADIIDKSNY